MITRCSLCPGVNKCVPSSGPLSCDYLFIGEAPGKDEDRKGIPFIGKTGKEVNEHYLPLAGLRRSSVRFTNSIQCLPPGHGGKLDMGRAKDVELLYCCAEHHLYNEIAECQPKLIIALGSFACRAVSGDEIDLDLQHGIPVETPYGTVFPMYHPAASLHEPKRMLQTRFDWIRLGRYIKGKLNLPVDEYPNPIYHPWQSDYVNSISNYLGSPLAIDTEVTSSGKPFCLTYSWIPGSGYNIRTTDTQGLRWFQGVLSMWRGPIIMHNAMFDLEVLRKMELYIPSHLVIDTMVRSYHLGVLPQGLKALCYRLLGMKMTDFSDTVLPYSTPMAIKYLRDALAYDWPKPQEDVIRDASGEWKLYKPQGMSTKLKRFLTDLGKNPNKSPFTAWDNWEDSHTEIESVCGTFPKMDISHVPYEEMLRYSCRDSDGTLRLWHKLESITKRVRRTVPESWIDVY